MANNTAKSLSAIRNHLSAVHQSLTLEQATTALELADMAADGISYRELPSDVRKAFSAAEQAVEWLRANGARFVGSNGARNLKVCG
jgi:hypothetical protein